jgi:hypothetical protein
MTRQAGKAGNGPDTDVSTADELKAKLVMETARVPWAELQRFYARGQVVRAAPELDLIEVAMAVAEDDKARVQPWLERGLFGEVAPSQAQQWFDDGTSLWTVVVAPWVLVQEDGKSVSL